MVALSHRHDPAALLRAVLDEDAPTLFVENKLLYTSTPAKQPPWNLRAVPLRGEPGMLPPLAYQPACGVGAGVVAAVAAELDAAGMAARTVGALAVPIPNARHLEDRVLPSAERVLEALTGLMRA